MRRPVEWAVYHRTPEGTGEREKRDACYETAKGYEGGGGGGGGEGGGEPVGRALYWWCVQVRNQSFFNVEKRENRSSCNL